MNKAVLMCRVSTEAQDYEAQIGDLKKYAQQKGITEFYVIATKESGYRDISEREGWLKTKQYFEEHPDYIADYIEPNRDQAPRLEYIRKIAFEDLDCCMAEILFDTLHYLSGRKGSIDPTTRLTYEYYQPSKEE